MAHNHTTPENDNQFGIAAIAGICFACLKPITKLGPIVTLVWVSICSILIYKLASASRERYLASPPTRAELLEDFEDEAAAEKAVMTRRSAARGRRAGTSMRCPRGCRP